jgi:ferredoxin
VAETGSSIIVTNEGNGDLSQTLPKVHIVLEHREGGADAGGRGDHSAGAGALGDGAGILRLHDLVDRAAARGDPDGPEQYHVVLLDNGRSNVLGTEFQEMLRCIRCGACMNHCPVYGAVGGHAYGWVYPGPMGAVLTPAARRRREGEATCPMPRPSAAVARSVCPVRIPLPKMMRHWREREFERHLQPSCFGWFGGKGRLPCAAACRRLDRASRLSRATRAKPSSRSGPNGKPVAMKGRDSGLRKYQEVACGFQHRRPCCAGKRSRPGLQKASAQPDPVRAGRSRRPSKARTLHADARDGEGELHDAGPERRHTGRSRGLSAGEEPAACDPPRR